MAEIDTSAAWTKFVESLSDAGRRIDETTRDASPEVRADGFRALSRALANQLGRLEWDDAAPEMVPFNLWRHKFLMDNPDCLYWVTDVAAGGRYRISGSAKNATFLSVNVYAGRGLEAQTVARATTDDLDFDGDGRYSVTIGGDESQAEGQWLAAPRGANMVWVRQFYDERALQAGTCEIERLDKIPPPPMIDPGRFAKRLATVAMLLDNSSRSMSHALTGHRGDEWNVLREWSEMQGGAIYTEPGIHYQRGAWKLRPGEVLVIDGEKSPVRHMSVLLYSSFFNTLDYRNRPVSLTGPHIKTDSQGRFRIVISGEDPGIGNWLDTEGRETGIFVIRWLQPTGTPTLPTARVMSVTDLRG